MKSHHTPRKGAGRPRICDLLDVYLFVERARRRRRVSVRKLVSDRRFVFEAKPSLFHYGPLRLGRKLSREALRRRYGAARQNLGLAPLPPGITSPAYDEFQRANQRFIEEILAVFPD